MITAFYKLLNNSLRVDLLVRIHTSKEGVNVSILADEMAQSGNVRENPPKGTVVLL